MIDLDDGETLRVQQGPDDFSGGGIEDDGGELRREIGARNVFLKAALVGEGVFGIGLGEFCEVLAIGKLLGEVLGHGELGLGCGHRVFRIGRGNEDFLEGDHVLGEITQREFDLVVFLLNFVGQWRRSVGELLAAHRLNDHFLAGHLAIAIHGEAAALEFLAELRFVAVVEFAHLALDFVVDDVGFDRAADVFELIEDDLAVDEFLEDFGLGFLELGFELWAAARKLGGELGENRCQHEGNLVLGDHPAVDLGGDAIDLDRATGQDGGGGAGARCLDVGFHLGWERSPGRRVAASTRERARRGFMNVVSGMDIGRRSQYRGEFSHGAGGLQAGKPGNA